MEVDKAMSEYDISHLALHTVIFVVPADLKKGKPEIRYPVEVTYSDHCYTKAVGDSQQREFDPVRYKLSKRLPGIISGLIERKCSFAQEQNLNYFTVELVDEDGRYEIYFEVFKKPKTKKLGLRVQSAYIREKEKPPRWRAIKFSVILFNVQTGKPIKAPK